MAATQAAEAGEGRTALAEQLARGRPLPPGAAEALTLLLGTPVSRDGLSRFFQPSFRGVRTYVIQARAAPDRSVDLTIVGVARDGTPAWTAERAFITGGDGSLEIHHRLDETDTNYRSRNVLVDTFRRELELLSTLETGPNGRVTVDAQGIGSYVCALHGFVFADETEEGPPLRSSRASEPDGDAQRMRTAAAAIMKRLALRFDVDPSALRKTLDRLAAAALPIDIAKVELAGTSFEIPDTVRGLVGGLGRALMLDQELPAWRAAMYPPGRDEAADRVGTLFRRRHTEMCKDRLTTELRQARDQIGRSNRAAVMKGLRRLAQIGPADVVDEIKALTEHSHRGVAAVARTAVKQITGYELESRILEYADNPKNDPRRRAWAYRVLAEYYPAQIEPRVPMLRVHPDARIQRSVLPSLVADTAEAGPALSSLLAANPWGDGPRSGLLELRLEIIDLLSRTNDSRTLPALMAAITADEPVPPEEALALSRALASHPDPRARRALTARAHRLDRPPVP